MHHGQWLHGDPCAHTQITNVWRTVNIPQVGFCFTVQFLLHVIKFPNTVFFQYDTNCVSSTICYIRSVDLVKITHYFPFTCIITKIT